MAYINNKDKDFDDKNIKKSGKKLQKKRVCVFCIDKTTEIDYKDVNKLKKFVSEKGKISPARTNGNCAKHQRQLTEAIKRARVMALLAPKAD